MSFLCLGQFFNLGQSRASKQRLFPAEMDELGVIFKLPSKAHARICINAASSSSYLQMFGRRTECRPVSFYLFNYKT